ncbi:hypothetical protein [Bacillus salipaludis]|uniref:Uncharacterized protein n=1 Tax=Bacillus salipaludis TaxID=2547811 RepID=A0ABW8RIM0_9BACI
MRLSRVEKYKRRKKTSIIGIKLNTSKRTIKGLLLTTSLGFALITTNSFAFAETDISTLLQKWYLEKLQTLEESLTISVKTETNNQKAILLERITEQTGVSIKELQNYAKNQETVINQRIKEKMEEASKAIQDKNKSEIETQKELINKQLEDTFINNENLNNEEQVKAP